MKKLMAILLSLTLACAAVLPALAEGKKDETVYVLANPDGSARRVILPTLAPALLTGFSLAFARALGEYGSVIFIAGNIPFKTEITALLIISKVEQFDIPGASVIAVVMLLAAFAMLFAINLLQAWSRRRQTV